MKASVLNPGSKSLLPELPAVIFGSMAVAAGLVMFTIPNNIAPGGVSGLATALAHVSPISVSLWSLLLNVPLLILALWKLGKRQLIMTCTATAMLSVFIELFAFLPVYKESRFIAALYGGALMGLGLGVLFRRGLSTGGTDLLALLTKELLPGIALGTLVLYIDAAVLLFALIIFKDPTAALYSLLTIYVMARFVDRLLKTKNQGVQ